MNCLFPRVKVQEGCEKELKKKSLIEKKAEVIEVNLVAFEVCYFKVLDILQRLMCIFWAMSLVHDMNSEKSVNCFLVVNLSKRQYCFSGKSQYCLAVILWNWKVLMLFDMNTKKVSVVWQ